MSLALNFENLKRQKKGFIANPIYTFKLLPHWNKLTAATTITHVKQLTRLTLPRGLRFQKGTGTFLQP